MEHATEGPSLVLPEGGDIIKALRNSPGFFRLWLAYTITMGGDWFTTVAVMTLALELTHSPRVASLIGICNTLPTFLVTPLSGVLADRFNRKRIILFCNLISAVTVLGFLLVHTAGEVWICYLCTAVLVIMAACVLPAATAGIPAMVGRENLVAANSLFGATWGVMLAVGSAAGGYVSSTLGRNAAFEIDAVALLIASILIFSIRQPDFRMVETAGVPAADAALCEAQGHDDETFGTALAHLLRNPALLLVVLAKAFWAVGGGTILLLSLFPVFVYRGIDPNRGVGILYSMRGVGTLLGPLLATILIRNQTRAMPRAIWISLVWSGIFYLLFAWSPTLELGAFAILLANLGAGAMWVVSTTMMQLAAPNRLMGRLSAIDLGAAMLTMSVSWSLCGEYAEKASPREVGVVCGLVSMAVGLLWAGLWPYFRRRNPILLAPPTLAEVKAQARLGQTP